MEKPGEVSPHRTRFHPVWAPLPWPGRASKDAVGMSSISLSLPGDREERASPREGSRAGCFVLQKQNREATGSHKRQALLRASGGRVCEHKRRAVSLELFILHNSNKHSRARMVPGEGQDRRARGSRGRPSSLGQEWLLSNNSDTRGHTSTIQQGDLNTFAREESFQDL